MKSRSLNTSANHIRWGVGIRSKKMKKQGLTESEGDYSPFEASSSIPTSTQGRFGNNFRPNLQNNILIECHEVGKQLFIVVHNLIMKQSGIEIGV